MEESLQSNLAAIVFTDIVGFSRLMSENESNALPRTRAELARLRELCEKHNGKVLKSTGDGLLMHFTSAVKAVACALEIQASRPVPEGEQPLRHRIGIHLGDVYLEDGDVMGDGVNIAARLQTQADPGGICISKTVYDVVKNRLAIQATFLGPRELKNITEAVPIYKILIEAQAQGGKVRSVGPAQRPAWVVPLVLGVLLALLLACIGLSLYAGMAKLRKQSVAATTTEARPAATLSPAAARIVGAWQSVQRRAYIIYLADGRIGVDLALGDRKILGIVGTWQATDDTLTVIRTDPKKTMVNQIISLTDSQMVLRSEMGPRFLERIPMPDLPIVVVSGLSSAMTKDPSRPQYPPIAQTVPADQSYNAGLTDFNNGDYDPAIAKFTEALALKPDFFVARTRRAQACELNGAYEKAIADYDQLIQAKPKDAVHYHGRAGAEIKAGKYQAALDDANTALGLKPGFVNALTVRAQAHLLMRDWPDAITDCNAALALEPNNASAFIYRGMAEKASGDVTAGQADIDRGQALQTASTPAH